MVGGPRNLKLLLKFLLVAAFKEPQFSGYTLQTYFGMETRYFER